MGKIISTMKLKLKVLLVIFYLTLCIFNHSYGQQSGFVKSEDLKIYYEDYGKGTPIVLLAGGPGASNVFMHPLVEELKNEYRLILIDQRATGNSILHNIDSSTITLDKYVEDIENVRKDLGIPEWIVIGHSWGGGLAMALASKYPNTISKLILIGSMGIDLEFLNYTLDNLKYSDEDLTHFEYWNDSARVNDNPEKSAYEIYRIIAKSRVYNDSIVDVLLENYVYEPSQSKVGDLMFKNLDAINYDLKPQLSNFKKPTLIIQGRQGFLGGWTAFKIFQTIPNCQIEFIERCGHFPYHEQPDQFFKVLRKFL